MQGDRVEGQEVDVEERLILLFLVHNDVLSPVIGVVSLDTGFEADPVQLVVAVLVARGLALADAPNNDTERDFRATVAPAIGLPVVASRTVP